MEFLDGEATVGEPIVTVKHGSTVRGRELRETTSIQCDISLKQRWFLSGRRCSRCQQQITVLWVLFKCVTLVTSVECRTVASLYLMMYHYVL